MRIMFLTLGDICVINFIMYKSNINEIKVLIYIYIIINNNVIYIRVDLILKILKI